MAFSRRCFCSVSSAYVNGQRQGRIMEKPFCVGESIADETVLRGSLPKLSVEDEIKIVIESKQALEDNSLLQKMKDLGMQRYVSSHNLS